MKMNNIQFRPTNDADKDWINEFLSEQWGAPNIVTRGKIHNALEIPGFIGIENNKPVGLITYVIEDNSCEIISLNSLRQGKGIGTKLIDVIKEVARKNNCKRVWLIVTNDNINALCFYQKRGFHLTAVYPDALKISRQLKPQIPLIGRDGIPLRDELELELSLDN